MLKKKKVILKYSTQNGLLQDDHHDSSLFGLEITSFKVLQTANLQTSICKLTFFV